MLKRIFFIAQVLLGSAAGLLAQHPLPSAELVPLGTNVNTPQADFAPIRYADKLYFTSTVTDPGTGANVDRTFSVLRNEPAYLLDENPKESNVDMANISMTLKADRLYYSLTKQSRNKKKEYTQLWYRDRNYDGTWGAPVRLPRQVNLPDFMAAQPSIGFDKSLNRQVLYFVSDRPGGQGGLDIWYSVLEPDHVKGEINFKEPVNLPVNTDKDEVTPFFSTNTQTLFFSSTGYRGYGGFDIFLTKKTANGSWEVPRNFEEPINSAANDRDFSFHDGSKMSYFASDRANWACPPATPDCKGLDIYQAQIRTQLNLEIVLEGQSKPLNGCNVELVDVEQGTIVTSLVAMPSNRAVLKLLPGKNYQLIVSQKGYYPIFTGVVIDPSEAFEVFEKRIALKPMLPGDKNSGKIFSGN